MDPSPNRWLTVWRKAGFSYRQAAIYFPCLKRPWSDRNHKTKTQSAEEVDEIKKSLDFLAGEISAVRLQQKGILDLFEEVKILRIQNAEKDKRLEYLESRLEDLEQYTWINDVIITGLKVRPRSYARAVGTDAGGEPGELDDSSTEQQVAAFLKSKGIQLDCNNIEACHPLPRRKDSDNLAIILRFVNRKHKTSLLKQGRKLKGSDVYMNDNLTKRNADIARKARHLKKQKNSKHLDFKL
ncbi:hypothetical protein NQZ68_015935 [Dissostichus eleginoides]|nr:hypothetical protein NQZ68_015935 [Dissostichus eleginoides]